MNGQASKRIRITCALTNFPVKFLKKAYRAKAFPMFDRTVSLGHSEFLKKYHDNKRRAS